MSDTGQLSDLWTARFLDYLGLGCILTGVDAGVKDTAYILAGVLIVAGGVALAVGLTWEQSKQRISPLLYASLRRMGSDARWWVAVLLALIISARGPAIIQQLKGTSSGTITGTIDIPAGAANATIPIPASLPYTIRKVEPDWEAAGTFVQSKESGHFEVFFNRGAPTGGGAIDWEIQPRAGNEVAAPAVLATEAPTVIVATPEPLIEQFVHNSGPFQQAATLIRTTPRPATHPVNIVSTEQSHDIAGAMVGVIQTGAPYGWKLVEHGQPGAFIGAPTEYALDDGITIRAKADNADAAMLWGILRASGLDVKFVSLDSTNSHNDVMLEIGNFPHR